MLHCTPETMHRSYAEIPIHFRPQLGNLMATAEIQLLRDQPGFNECFL